MKTIKLKPVLSDEEVSELEGKFISDKYIHHLITEDTRAVNENGETIACYKKKHIPKSILNSVRPYFRKSSVVTDNRGTASGELPENLKSGDKYDGFIVIVGF